MVLMKLTQCKRVTCWQGGDVEKREGNLVGICD